MTSSTSTTAYDFSDIRPYSDNEVPQKLQELIGDPLFMKLANYLWPAARLEDFSQKAAKVRTSMDFQFEFMHDAIHKILELSSSGLSSSGFENLVPGSRHLFIANHRDIFLDAALLQIELVRHGFPTTEIAFGSNLSEKGFISTFAKLNRMFPVVRGGSKKELYDFSGKLSSYIRENITQNDTSVWLAQRNGRTKDGYDLTQAGLLKMLDLSGGKNFIENFNELSIVPLSISYEYEPCAFLKARELFLTGQEEGYKKSEGEDLNSIVTGLVHFKGRIHLSAGPVLTTEDLEKADRGKNINEKYRLLAEIIDTHISNGYHFFPNNFIAAQEIEKSGIFSDKFSDKESSVFKNYLDKGIREIGGDKSVLENILLRMYAAPVLRQAGSL